MPSDDSEKIFRPRKIYDINESTHLLTYSRFNVKPFYVKYKSKRCDCDIDILWNLYPDGNFYYDGIIKSYFKLLIYSNGIKAPVINKPTQICIQTATVAWHTRSRTLCPRENDERKMITRGNPLYVRGIFFLNSYHWNIIFLTIISSIYLVVRQSQRCV